MADIVNTNIALPKPFWFKCKTAALKRGISLNQLVKDGLKLALDENDGILIDPKGRVSNDLKGVFKRKVKKEVGQK